MVRASAIPTPAFGREAGFFGKAKHPAATFLSRQPGLGADPPGAQSLSIRDLCRPLEPRSESAGTISAEADVLSPRSAAKLRGRLVPARSARHGGAPPDWRPLGQHRDG